MSLACRRRISGLSFLMDMAICTDVEPLTDMEAKSFMKKGDHVLPEDGRWKGYTWQRVNGAQRKTGWCRRL